MVEYLLKDFKIPTSRGTIEASVLIGEERVRLGTSLVLEQSPIHSEREVINCTGTILIPSIHDSLSWIQQNSRQTDIRRLLDSMAKGGVVSSFLEVDKPVSRVKWLDIGRKIKNVAGDKIGLYGPASYIRRWKHKEGSELPKLREIQSPEQVRAGKEISFCHAQNHRTDIQHEKPAVKLWWVEKEIALEEIKEPLSQEYINEKLCNPILEKEKLDLCKGREVLVIGTTLLYSGAPYLISLLPPARSYKIKGDTILGVPLRNVKTQRRLLNNMMESDTDFHIAVGHFDGELEKDWISHGVPIMENTISYLITTLFEEGFSFNQIYTRILSDTVLYHEKLDVKIPKSFCLLKKGEGKKFTSVLTFSKEPIYSELS